MTFTYHLGLIAVGGTIYFCINRSKSFYVEGKVARATFAGSSVYG